jgi:3-(3-hydroxy-phenyl)propionate hydroxylase
VVDADVVIVGAGPVGLTLANYVGQYGRSVVVLEARPTLIDFPRGVGMDDECLRAFQGISLVDGVLPHTTPNQVLRFVNRKGDVLLEVDPKDEVYGWPRRSGFIQPLVDRVLLEGLERFPQVKVVFGHQVVDTVDRGDRVEVRCEGPDGRPVSFTGAYVCGCDGGSSGIRKALGISFDGRSESTRWLVVDLHDDPLGYPNSYMVCDPARPHVSIGLPHGLRRFEFLLGDDEFPDPADVREEDVRRLLADAVGPVWRGTFAPPRVYVHHARIASAFRAGRFLLAGDAAHLMPVWQGQGYNSGIRDAANLGWKLAAVLDGTADDAVLDTYDVERREHAAAMINLSVLTGRVISPRSPVAAWGRDRAASVLNAVPAARRYFLDMRYKPMPGLDSRATVPARGLRGPDPVGRLLPQPQVRGVDGVVPLDEALGPWFALVAWGNDPQRSLSPEAAAISKALGAAFVSVHPHTELGWARQNLDESVTVVGDETGALRRWFDAHRVSTILVRPDRIVAAAGRADETSDLLREFARRSTVGSAGRTG